MGITLTVREPRTARAAGPYHDMVQRWWALKDRVVGLGIDLVSRPAEASVAVVLHNGPATYEVRITETELTAHLNGTQVAGFAATYDAERIEMYVGELIEDIRAYLVCERNSYAMAA